MRKSKIARALAVVLAGFSLTQCTPLPNEVKNKVENINFERFGYPVTRQNNVSNPLLKPDIDMINLDQADLVKVRDRRDQGRDIYFNQVMNDPYRWLEEADEIDFARLKETSRDRNRNEFGSLFERDPEHHQKLHRVKEYANSEVNQWVEAQNSATENYLKKIPYYSTLQKQFEKLETDFEYVDAEFNTELGTFIYRRDKGSHYYKLYAKDKEGKERILLDEAKLSSDGSVTIIKKSMNKKGNYFVYLTAKGNADVDTKDYSIYVFDTQSKKLVGQPIHYVKKTDINWLDDQRFYYNGETTYGWEQIRLHQVGQSPISDEIVFNGRDFKMYKMNAWLTEDNRFLVIENEDWLGELYLKDQKTGKVYQIHSDKKLDEIKRFANFPNFKAAKFVDLKGDDIYFITTENNEFGELVKANIYNPQKTRKVIIPAQKQLMKEAVIYKDHFFVNYMAGAYHRLIQFDQNGQMLKEITPRKGYISDLVVVKEDEPKEEYLSFYYQDLITPKTSYKYRPEQSNKFETKIKYNYPFDSNLYETKIFNYPSKDGTLIPLTIAYKKGLKLNGKNPTLLYGYGGFNYAETPYFSTMRANWIANGGIFAMANLRGGSEFGEAWHEAGTLTKKQNVFDDFIAAGEFLIKQGYTSSDYLALNGASNGGLLVGATMVLRPDLAKVALPDVGVLDMLRHERMNILGWMKEYGSAQDSKAMFEYLKGYSPYHNIKPNVCYPSTLVMTSKRDDRVYPSHSYKFTAALQATQTCPRPAFLYTARTRGHSPYLRQERIEENAKKQAFAFYEMGIKVLP